MNKIIFKATQHPNMLLWYYKQCVEEVLNKKSIRGISLKHILQESLPQFSTNDIHLDIYGNIVLESSLYNAIEFGTLTIPKLQIISLAKKRMGRRPAWQIVS